MSDSEFHPIHALDAAIEGARLASPVIETGDGRRFVYVPDRYDLKDVTDPLALPWRARHTVTLDDRNSMTAFVNRFQRPETVLIADFPTLTISAVIDFHADNESEVDAQARACDFRADFKLLPSEEFLRWDAMEGKMHPQAEFAEFLDENAVDIAEPDPATMVEISRELEATIGAAFKSAVSPESGDRKFVYETETHVKGDIIVPKRFSLNIPLYNGEGPELLEARFRFRAGGDGLLLGFVWHRVEYQRRAFFNAIATQIAEDTGRPVYAGRGLTPLR